LIFPEGTRGDSDAIFTFKSGGFHLAKAARVPIIPVGLRGTRAIGPKHSVLFWPGTVEVHIGAPIMPDEIDSKDLYPLMDSVRTKISSLSDLPVAPSPSARATRAPA
jgi:1-acyl-sn-glycerol-3-phosphate acyltransferase